jgi:hypothetical protein
MIPPTTPNYGFAYPPSKIAKDARRFIFVVTKKVLYGNSFES